MPAVRGRPSGPGDVHRRRPGTEPYWLPSGEAVSYYHTLKILVRCDGDLSRIQAAARACRRRASGMSAQGARSWLRAAELCEQTIEEYLDSGAATDTEPAAN